MPQEELSTDRRMHQVIQVTRIVVCGLAFGVLAFGALMIYLRGNAGGKPMVAFGDLPIITTVSVVLAVISLGLRAFLVPSMIKKRASTQPLESLNGASVPDIWLRLYQSQVVFCCALLESAAIFSFIAYFLEGEQITLAIASALLLGILLHFPTQARILNWVEDQIRYLRNESL